MQDWGPANDQPHSGVAFAALSSSVAWHYACLLEHFPRPTKMKAISLQHLDMIGYKPLWDAEGFVTQLSLEESQLLPLP